MSEVISEYCSPILTEVKQTASEVKSESCSTTLAEVVLTASKPVQHKDIKVVINIIFHQSLRYNSI